MLLSCATISMSGMACGMWKRLLLAVAAALVATTSALVASNDRDKEVIATRPVLLIPGFASSQLHAWKKQSCSHAIQKNLYRDVNVGDRIWIDAARILAQGDCWLRCMKLHAGNQTERECKLRAGDGLSAIGELDPGLISGPLSVIWRGLIKDLVDHFDFGPDEIIVAAYDWRLPPSKLQERDRYFASLKNKIEHAVAMHKSVGGLVVIAHSMGNNIFRYFLAWLKHEVGRNHWQRWIDHHISAYFAVGAPLLGSSEALELITSGLTQGLPLAQSEVRKLVVTFGSIISFLPIPSTPSTSHDSDVLVSVRYPSIDSKQTVMRNYTSVDIASGSFFRDMAAHDPIFSELEEARRRFYVDDDVLDAFSPWDRPPIASVYAVYGVNMPTKYNYVYHDTDTAGHWFQVALENEEGHRQVCNKTGDATVPYHSLSWAHTWLGPNGASVNITRAPQSVYFSTQEIKRFKAIRQGDKHHADYVRGSKQRMCHNGESSYPGTASSSPSFFEGIFGKSTQDFITFYESSREHRGAVTSSSVWEVDGARHREILSNPVFLRELRAELRHVFVGQAASDKSSRPPVVDSDCYWNYRQAKCEFSQFCQYRYQFGDVTLDQSCRIRIEWPKPPAHVGPLPMPARNSGATSSEANGYPGSNDTPVSLPIEGGDDEGRMITVYPSGKPGYCLVPCEYCLKPRSRGRTTEVES